MFGKNRTKIENILFFEKSENKKETIMDKTMNKSENIYISFRQKVTVFFTQNLKNLDISFW